MQKLKLKHNTIYNHSKDFPKKIPNWINCIIIKCAQGVFCIICWELQNAKERNQRLHKWGYHVHELGCLT